MSGKTDAGISLFKKILIGAGVIGGTTAGGYGGYQIGKAKTTSDLTKAFTEANTAENHAIAAKFRHFNANENRAIAKHYLRKGLVLGNSYRKGGMQKKSEFVDVNEFEKVANIAFVNGLEKLGMDTTCMEDLSHEAVSTIRDAVQRSV